MRGIARRDQCERERRRGDRQPAGACAWLSSARLRHGPDLLIVNLAEGGALVEAATRLLPGSSVELYLAAPGWRWFAAARVLRCGVSALVPEQGVRYRAALQFQRPLHPPGPQRDAAANAGEPRTDVQRGTVTGDRAGSCYPFLPQAVRLREVATRFRCGAGPKRSGGRRKQR